MAIRFNLKPCVLNVRPARSGISAAQDTALSGMSALSAKAADLVERAKLMRAISDLEDEIALQMCTIGELIYATHRGTPSDSEEMQKILDYVDDLEDELEGHEQQLKLLMGVTPCPVCDGDVTEDEVYCRQCGHPLPVSPAEES